MGDRVKWAKLLKQVAWNKPTFVESYLVTKLNLDKKDENSFYHKDETPCLYSEWLTSIKPGVLLGKLVNPLEFVSPVFVERVGTQWRVNKDETDKAIEQLSNKGLVAIHCSKEENEPIYVLSEALCEWKVFLEGQLMIPKDWPNLPPNLKSCLEQAFSFYLTEDVLFQEFCSRYPEQAEVVRNYFGEIELASPKTLRKYGLVWEKLTYSYTPETVSNETRVTRRSSLSPKEKLTTVIELMESEEMGRLVSMLRDKGLVLNPRNQFVLAVELVLGFNSTVIVEEQGEE
jgi:hypothetical protein